MTIHVMDIFYMIMIAVIFGFIIHLETQCKMILEILEQHNPFCVGIKFEGRGTG